MRSRTALKFVLMLVLGLPLLLVVLTWIADLFNALGDPAVGGVLGHINTAVRVVWLLCIVGLVLLSALQSMDEPMDEPMG